MVLDSSCWADYRRDLVSSGPPPRMESIPDVVQVEIRYRPLKENEDHFPTPKVKSIFGTFATKHECSLLFIAWKWQKIALIQAKSDRCSSVCAVWIQRCSKGRGVFMGRNGTHDPEIVRLIEAFPAWRIILGIIDN